MFDVGAQSQRSTYMLGPVAVQHKPDDAGGSFGEQADMNL